jgi:hypothetical protein
MGYTLQETAEEVVKIYKSGQFENKYVYNSGIKPDGTINFLKQGTYQVLYLGSTDATLLNGPSGYTAELYLKKDCYNLCWLFIPPVKDEIKKDSPKEEKKFISGDIILYQWCEEYHWEVTQQATWWLAEVRKEYLNAGYTGVTTSDPALAGSEEVVQNCSTRKVYTYTHDPGRRPIRDREVSKIWR